MKKNVVLISAIVALLLVLWQCSKKDAESASLKESLTLKATNLNTAVDAVSKSSGYKILSLSDQSQLKSGSVEELTMADSIRMADIKGVYEYVPRVDYKMWCFGCLYKLFKKTGESDKFIVKLPREKVFFPYRMHAYQLKDSALKNNFVVTASDYHKYINGFLYDYKLTADLTVSDTAVGSIDIRSNRNSSRSNYSSVYTFSNGYSIKVLSNYGDTATSGFSFEKGPEILLKESVKSVKVDGTRHREKEYSLTIGNIEIKRYSASDSITILLNGVVQTNAKVEVIDADSSEDQSVCEKRDIQITFDDATKVKISELIGPSLDILKTMVGSMKSVYFATNVVDYIAWNIAKSRH